MALYIITGPPAAGKTTWTQHHAQPGDIIIDYDRLAHALTGPHPDPHDHPQPLRDIAFRARTAAINEALKHTTTTDTYIIHTHPTPNALATYHHHNAHIITIDPGPEITLQRCKEQRPPAALKAARRWYATPPTPGTPTPQKNSRRW